MRDDPDLQALTAALLDAARSAGAEQADALAVGGASLSVEVRGGRLEHAERADGTEIGLRVLIGGRQACVAASELSPQTMREMAERAVAMAREAPVDDALALADPSQLAPTYDGALELCELADGPSPETLLDAALRAEAAALEVDGVRVIDSANAAYARRDLFLATSNGFGAGFARSSHSISAVAITGEGTGMDRDWAAESRVWAQDMPAPESIGRLAGERTAARAGARRPPTGAVPVIFDQRVAPGLIGHLLSAVNGSAVARGATWLRDALGEQVLPPGFDLIEDPRLPRFGASRPFDAEGLPTAARAIVRDGVLQGWTLDIATANKLGLQSTASAMRGASSPPSPGVSNIRLSPGAVTPEQMVHDLGRGLIVTSFLGSSINPTTGDYSRGAAGFWVEGGEIAYPVNECTIAGNLRDMLMRMTAACDLPDWRSHAVPTLLVEGMTLAGG